MRIHIRLHGALRDKLPPENKGQAVLEVSGDVTATAVLDQLTLRGYLQVAINQTITENLDTPLQDGDTLEVFRPAAGG